MLSHISLFDYSYYLSCFAYSVTRVYKMQDDIKPRIIFVCVRLCRCIFEGTMYPRRPKQIIIHALEYINSPWRKHNSIYLYTKCLPVLSDSDTGCHYNCRTRGIRLYTQPKVRAIFGPSYVSTLWWAPCEHHLPPWLGLRIQTFVHSVLFEAPLAEWVTDLFCLL